MAPANSASVGQGGTTLTYQQRYEGAAEQLAMAMEKIARVQAEVILSLVIRKGLGLTGNSLAALRVAVGQITKALDALEQ